MISEVRSGKSQKREYDISVLILTYKPVKEKVFLTIVSALFQKGVDLQIIISDDGSPESYVQEFVDFMEERSFYDYKVIVHNQNEGTVVNFMDALNAADGHYIKSLGPGDCFSAEDVAQLWLKHLEREKTKLSFCDAVYYRKSQGIYESVLEVAHPQNPEIYKKNKKMPKKYYIFYNDIFLAAAVICERELMKKYTKSILGRVKYAEDNMFRLMLFDGVECSYLGENAVFYEWGSGISTKENSEFTRQIKRDWDEITKCICGKCNKGCLEKKIKCYYMPDADKNTFKEKLVSILAKIDIYFHVKQNRRKKRLTIDGDLKYLYKIEEQVYFS